MVSGDSVRAELFEGVVFVSYGLCDLKPVIGGLEGLREESEGACCTVTTDEEEAELGLELWRCCADGFASVEDMSKSGIFSAT